MNTITSAYEKPLSYVGGRWAAAGCQNGRFGHDQEDIPFDDVEAPLKVDRFWLVVGKDTLMEIFEVMRATPCCSESKDLIMRSS